MNLDIKIKTACALLLFGGLMVPQMAAAQVEVGGTTDTTAYPFGTDGSTGSFTNYSGEYQQIYSASAFTQPVNITGISFASASDDLGIGQSAPETATYLITMALSNTSASINAPSTTFANNDGTNMITVFSGKVVANLQANNVFDLNIPLQTPFAYVPGLPGQGNLLLDLFINKATSDNQTDIFQSGNTGQTSRVYYSNGTPVSAVRADQNGLRTLFTVTPAPEPSPILTLLLGVGGIALACGLKAAKRKRKLSSSLLSTSRKTSKTMSKIIPRASRINPLGIAAVVGCVLLAAGPKMAAAQTYSIMNLGTLGGDTSATGLGASGAATGVSAIANGSTTTRAFLTLPGGTIQDLGTLGGSSSYGAAITTGAATQVTGYSEETDETGQIFQHAFLYTSGGTSGPLSNPQMRDLGTLSDGSTANSAGSGINALGQVVGDSINTVGHDDAFRTSPNAPINGATDDLGTLGGDNSTANAINLLGQTVGNSATASPDTTHAFRSSPNGLPVTLTDLGTLGGSYSNANAINASGQVVGQADLAADSSGNTADHAALWTQGTDGTIKVTDLGSLGGDSAATSINDAGAIVGYAFLADGSTFDAFLYQNSKLVDLNTLISPASGWILQYASAINNNGQIAGYGLFNGQTRAFLLNPTVAAAPEPSALGVLAIGLGSLGLLAARKRRQASAH